MERPGERLLGEERAVAIVANAILPFAMAFAADTVAYSWLRVSVPATPGGSSR